MMSRLLHKSARLGRRRRLVVYAVGLGVWLSGGLWLLFHYFFVQQGEFGPTVHPLEPWWLRLHGAFGFAALWMFGLLWGIHITKAWPYERRRWSGSIVTGIFLWLIITGYLLYYAGGENTRSIISLLHWTVGLGSPIAFVWHRVGSFRHRTIHAGTKKTTATSHLTTGRAKG